LFCRTVDREFWQKHPEAQGVLREWHSVVEAAECADFAYVREFFNSADYVLPCTVFNVGGNNYRLVVIVRYRFKKIFVQNTAKLISIEPAHPKDPLRFLMEARGLKREDLASLVPQSNLSAILAGKRKISATLAGKLGKFFGISPAAFVPAQLAKLGLLQNR